jgi:hypothetical protein
MSEELDSERFAILGRELIAEEMKRQDLVGGAFDGSLATGRTWATSDLDFTIFPRASTPPAEPRRVPAYRFYYPNGPLARHHQYVDLRVVDGVFVNMHTKTKPALVELRRDYPRSFIESAETVPADLEATHFLDGLAIMRVVEDPEGFLAATKAFVAGHRFAPEVLRPRLALMDASAERRLREARAAAARGGIDATATHDLARVFAQMWIERAARVYSKKEQDTLLLEVSREAKAPHAHELYRAILGLDGKEERLEAILAPIAEYGARVDAMFKLVEDMAAAYAAQVGQDVVERCRAYRLWAALTLRSIPVAFEKGCYAHMAFAIQGVGPSALDRFVALIERVAPSQAAAIAEVCRAEIAQSREVWELFGLQGEAPEVRGRQLDAAADLLELTRGEVLRASGA